MPLTTSDPTFLPIDNELPLRLLRRLRLVPQEGLGVVRRALFLTLLAWVPIVIWAAFTGRLADTSGESLLAHYGVNVRCLIAIPLLILAEPSLQKMARRITRLLQAGGLVDAGPDSAFVRLAADMRALRDKSVPWVIMLGVVLVFLASEVPSPNDDALSWAVGTDGTLGFGAYWFAYVGRALFIALVLAWLWRILLVTWWFWRISRLPLSIVPSHPDKAGGLAFFDKVPQSFALVTFVLSVTITSRWAHEIISHGAKVAEFKFPALLFAALWTVYLLLPLLVFVPKLKSTRSAAVASYSALVGEQGRLVHRQWILHEAVEDAPIVEAPGIGVIADAAAMYDGVKKMRFAPISSKTLMHILVPMALPFIAVAALQIPLKDLLLKLFKALT